MPPIYVITQHILGGYTHVNIYDLCLCQTCCCHGGPPVKVYHEVKE